MKRLFIFILCLFLAGCSLSPTPPNLTEPGITPPHGTVPQTVPQTFAPTAPPTEPPDPVDLLLAGMSIEERVGQLFLARCNADTAAEDIAKYHLGGLVLFAVDFENETPDSMREKLNTYQAAVSIPLLLAVDEEGGTVCRVSRYPAFRESRFPSPRQAYSNGGMARVLEYEREKGQLLAGLGLNVNLGPVCDICTDPSGFMYQRSLGLTPEETGQFIAGTVAEMRTQGIGSALKHFPGYGNNDDTHVGIARDNRALEELESRDLIPFSAGIEAGCGCIMVAHIFVDALDSSFPASLSPAVHRYLREKMGFQGVIVTDDLVMEAITDLYGAGEAAVLAVLAGNDLLCATDYAVQYQAVLAAVENGRISVEMLNATAGRVLRWKIDMGLL